MARMSPGYMESLARRARKAFPAIPFAKKVDYSSRVTCHGNSRRMSPDQLAQAASCIGEDDHFIPEELHLTYNNVYVVGRYENTKATESVCIDILSRTDGNNDDFNVIRKVTIKHRPIPVFFIPY